MNIITQKRSSDFIAYVEGNKGIWEAGTTEKEAVRKLRVSLGKLTEQRVIVYEMQGGTEEVFPLYTVEDEQHERAQAEHELHSRDTAVVGYHFEYREVE